MCRDVLWTNNFFVFLILLPGVMCLKEMIKEHDDSLQCSHSLGQRGSKIYFQSTELKSKDLGVVIT